MDAAGRPEVFRVLMVLGAALLAVLTVALRRLSRRAALDEAEETLRSEFEQLPPLRCAGEPHATEGADHRSHQAHHGR